METDSIVSAKYWSELGRPPSQVTGHEASLYEEEQFALNDFIFYCRPRKFSDEADFIRHMVDNHFSTISTEEMVVRYLEFSLYISSIPFKKDLPKDGYIIIGERTVSDNPTEQQDESLEDRVLHDLLFALEDEVGMRLVYEKHIPPEFIQSLATLCERLNNTDGDILVDRLGLPIRIFARRLEGLIAKIENFRGLEQYLDNINRFADPEATRTYAQPLHKAGDAIWQQYINDRTYPIPACFGGSEMLPPGDYFHYVPGVVLPKHLRDSFAQYTQNTICHIGIGPKPDQYVRIKAKFESSFLQMKLDFINAGVSMCTIDNTGEIRTFFGTVPFKRIFEIRGDIGTYEYIRLLLFTYIHEITQKAVSVEQRRVRTERKARGVADILQLRETTPNVFDRLYRLLVPRVESTFGNSQTDNAVEVLARERGVAVYKFNAYPRRLPPNWHRSVRLDEIIRNLGLDTLPQFTDRGFDIMIHDGLHISPVLH